MKRQVLGEAAEGVGTGLWGVAGERRRLAWPGKMFGCKGFGAMLLVALLPVVVN